MRWTFFLAVVMVSVAPVSAADTPAEKLAFYEKQVLPVLKANCLKCHGDDPKKLRGGFALTSREAILKGGDTGPAVDEKNIEASFLVKAIRYTHEDANSNMPPTGKLKDADITTLVKWVSTGITMPENGGATQTEAKPKGADKNYWAYQPVTRPQTPSVKNTAWVKTPIDALILKELEAKNLTPVGPAEARALIRRMTYDLTGLPPTPQEIDTFEKAHKANAQTAIDTLIERLLASQHYGEKWGRHWLDIVRYAETNGYERDSAKPFAYRYRDYVIRSFNADKPYDRFLKEQLAGDEMPGDNPDAVIATGFYRLGVWDDEPADKPLALYDGFDDLVTTVGQGMLGMTMNCTRCHDHKGDFFPQEDYYKLVAFFRDIKPYNYDVSTRTSTTIRDITSPEKRRLYEAELQERQKQIAATEKEMKPIEDAAILKMEPKDQLAVQDGHRDDIVRKVPLLLQGDEKKNYLALKRKLEDLKRKPSPHQELALAVANPDLTPPMTQVLIRGNPGSKGKDVTPGFPEVFGLPEPKLKNTKTSTGRRTALAEWIASPKNPLTARVMMNRVWQHHFGKGIVPTPNDFGKFGEKPTNPALLDYLASEFVAQGWSLKAIHRQIMKSSVYQLSSTANTANLKADPANVLRWRFDMRRLSAEEMRDSILALSGKLDRTMFGPSVYPKIPDEVLAGQSRPGEGWPYDAGNPDKAHRRSIYVHVKRNLQVPILISHDQADPDSTCPVRYTTTVPTQALGLLNGEFANDQARLLAARLAKLAPNDLAGQVTIALQESTGRKPTAEEVARDVDFVQTMQKQHRLDDRTALARYALLVLNSNEFAYLD
jgi:mono/diheme cytochrome c family protein